jgi:hypothetical protein
MYLKHVTDVAQRRCDRIGVEQREIQISETRLQSAMQSAARAAISLVVKTGCI